MPILDTQLPIQTSKFRLQNSKWLEPNVLRYVRGTLPEELKHSFSNGDAMETQQTGNPAPPGGIPVPEPLVRPDTTRPGDPEIDPTKSIPARQPTEIPPDGPYRPDEIPNRRGDPEQPGDKGAGDTPYPPTP